MTTQDENFVYYDITEREKIFSLFREGVELFHIYADGSEALVLNEEEIEKSLYCGILIGMEIPNLNIVVLDYSACTVTHYNKVDVSKYDGADESEKVEKYLSEKGYHLSNCSWMSSKKSIEFINE